MIDQRTLKRLLLYDAEAGVFTWRVAVGGKCGYRIPAGSVAGTLNAEGYRYITVKRRAYRASRLAFLYMTGTWPPDQVDHRNRIPSDDRWSNLRLATSSQNKANSSMYRNNTSGFTGVYWDAERGQWRAKATINGKRKWLGRFSNPEAAHAAYLAAVSNTYGEFAAP